MSTTERGLELERVLAQVTHRVMQLPDVLALLLVGSTARGDRSPNSDVDFLTLMRGTAPWSVGVRDGGRKSWVDVSGFEIEVGYTSAARVRERMLAEADLGSSFRLQLFTEGHLLAGGGTEYGQLVEDAHSRYRQGPPPLSERNRKWEGFDAWCRLRRLRAAKGPAELAFLGSELLQHLVGLTFRLAGVWPPRLRDALSRLDEIDDVLARQARRYLEVMDTDAPDLLLQRMAERIADRYDLELTGDYESASR